MVMMSPQSATTNSAPAESRTSRIAQDMTARRPLGVGVGGKAELRLGDAHREVAATQILQLRELVANRFVGLDVAGAIDALGDGADLVNERHLVGIEQAELCASVFGQVNDRMGQFDRPLAALRPMVGDDRLDAFGRAQFLQLFVFFRSIGAETVDRDHRRHAELPDIGEMAREIGEALFECPDILFAQCRKRHAAMHL